MAWDAYLKAKWDNENSDEYALKVAHSEGVAEGRDAGMQEGIEKGAQEEKLEVAQKMKAKGFDIQTISEITGLSPEEIDNA